LNRAEILFYIITPATKYLKVVIPAPHQVRDKLQPVEDSDLSENPVNPITSGCRIKACPGLDPGSGMTVLGLFTSSRVKNGLERAHNKYPFRDARIYGF